MGDGVVVDSCAGGFHRGAAESFDDDLGVELFEGADEVGGDGVSACFSDGDEDARWHLRSSILN